MDADVAGHQIADRRLLGLICKRFKAGVMEDGRRAAAATKGTPQGAVISPSLANIYLHYVLDLWARQWRQRHARGDVIVVRYAGDSVVGFSRLISFWCSCRSPWPGSVYPSTPRRHG